MGNDTSGSSRRAFFAASGLAGAATLLASGESRAGELTADEKANAKVVADFCDAWPSLDVEKLGSFLADNATFRMIETAPRIEGKEAIMKGIGDFLMGAKSARFDVMRSHVIGNVVINERIDYFEKGENEMAFHVTGFFMLRDGKIVEWQDYMMSDA